MTDTTTDLEVLEAALLGVHIQLRRDDDNPRLAATKDRIVHDLIQCLISDGWANEVNADDSADIFVRLAASQAATVRFS